MHKAAAVGGGGAGGSGKRAGSPPDQPRARAGVAAPQPAAKAPQPAAKAPQRGALALSLALSLQGRAAGAPLPGRARGHVRRGWLLGIDSIDH